MKFKIKFIYNPFISFFSVKRRANYYYNLLKRNQKITK